MSYYSYYQIYSKQLQLLKHLYLKYICRSFCNTQHFKKLSFGFLHIF